MRKLFLFSSLMLTPLVASAGLINFEGYAAGTRIDNEYVVSDGVTINGENTARGTSNVGVIFDTDNVTGGDSDLGGPFSNSNGSLGASNPGNVLIIHENFGTCTTDVCTNPDDEGSRPAGYFEITFDEAVTLNSIDFFDIETAENGSTDNNRIEIYDLSDTLIANNFFTPDTGGDNTWDRLLFGVSDVGSLRINMGGSGAIDNIDFTKVPPTGGDNPVPAPASIALFGIGLIGLSWARRKKS